jgi:hypothetical protein
MYDMPSSAQFRTQSPVMQYLQYLQLYVVECGNSKAMFVPAIGEIHYGFRSVFALNVLCNPILFAVCTSTLSKLSRNLCNVMQ